MTESATLNPLTPVARFPEIRFREPGFLPPMVRLTRGGTMAPSATTFIERSIPLRFPRILEPSGSVPTKHPVTEFCDLSTEIPKSNWLMTRQRIELDKDRTAIPTVYGPAEAPLSSIRSTALSPTVRVFGFEPCWV